MQPIIDFSFPPALIIIVGALFIPFFNDRLRPVYMLALPIIAFITLMSLPNGEYWTYSMLGYKLILGKIDGLSRIFGIIFIIASFIGAIYSMKVKDNIQHVAGFVYAGSAIGVTFAADFFSFYIFWEFMAIASTFLILARKTKESQKAGFRYIMVHIFGGLSLLAGIILQIKATGTTEFSFIGLDSFASYFIFIGVAVNAAVVPLHGWLKDAYPEATVTGTVFLSAFTTKSAVYVMARMFPGTPLLIWLGVAMTIFPIFYAILENDIRRVLSYSLINQVGFMLCGIGIGTELALNGVAAHAFCHILYKALLFMSAGAVLERTGKINCTDLGGLYRTMPLTCIFCIIGAASISAVPLFSGFVSKSMIITAAGDEHYVLVWLIFQFATAGIFHHAGIGKVLYFMFFGKDSGLRPKEAPVNMLVAMGISAFLCIYLAINYELLYSLLPFGVEYIPYTVSHVIVQLQYLVFSIFAFYILIKTGIFPAVIKAEHLDADWFYRKGSVLFDKVVSVVANGINNLCDIVLVKGLTSSINKFAKNAPATLSIILMTPFKMLFGSSERGKSDLSVRIEAAFITGSVPVGIGAAVAGLFIVFLFCVK